MLASMKKEMLRKQFKRRGREKNACQTSRYLENFDAIWELQAWLLEEADEAGIPVIENWNVEDTVRAALDLVIGKLMKSFPPQPADEVWES
jgi:2-phosphoglycerate kinase